MENLVFPTTIGDKYSSIVKIGEGGMGAIFKAHDEYLNKTVAIKLVNPLFSEQALPRFQREAQASGKLNHPNIVRTMDFGVADGITPYLVMEFIDGESLYFLVKHQAPMRLSEVLPFAEQILSALEYAHENGVVHRDMKPSNIMLLQENGGPPVVKLVDFGLAKLQDCDQRLTSTGSNLGSPAYMSPEQARGEEGDERSDIYSFGVILFEMLTGRVPFRGESAMQTIAEKMSSQAPRLSEMRPDLEFLSEIEFFVAKCLSLDPADRFQSAAEIKPSMAQLKRAEEEILRQVSNDDTCWEAITCEAETPAATVSNAVPRVNPWLWASLLTVGLIVVGSAGYSYLQADKNQTKTPLKDTPTRQTLLKVANNDFSDPAADQPRFTVEKNNKNYLQFDCCRLGSTRVPDQPNKIYALTASGRNASKRLIFNGFDNPRQLVNLFGLVPRVNRVEFNKCRLNGEVFARLRRMDLDSLKLNQCSLRTQSKPSERLILPKNLRALNLSKSNVRAEDLPGFLKLPLVTINLKGCELVTPESLEKLAAIKSLKEVTVGGEDLTRDHLAALSKFEQVRAICIQDVSAEEFKDGLRLLSNLKNLEVLMLQKWKTVPLTLAADLSTLTHLKRIQLKNITTVNRDVIKALASQANLRNLCIEKSLANDVSLQDLASLKRIELLSIKEKSISRKALQKLMPNSEISDAEFSAGTFNRAGMGTGDRLIGP